MSSSIFSATFELGAVINPHCGVMETGAPCRLSSEEVLSQCCCLSLTSEDL